VESNLYEDEFGDSFESSTLSEDVMALSLAAVTSSGAASVMQVEVVMCNREVLFLIDSGSNTSFLNQALAHICPKVTPLLAPAKVKVANGAKLMCTTEVTNCVWTTGGHKFHTSMKILPLGMYDAILGIACLASCSPTTMDWDKKIMEVKDHGVKFFSKGYLTMHFGNNQTRHIDTTNEQ
jgi:hypothetical protein